MRQRTLKPGFFTNEDLCALPPLVRLLFAGLWLIADREGRFEDRPVRIKAQLFPYEPDFNAEGNMQALELHGFIQRYEVDGTRFACIPKFTKNQNPHPKETPSVIPTAVKLHGKQPASNVKVVAGNAGSSFPSGSSGISVPVESNGKPTTGKLLEDIPCPQCGRTGTLKRSLASGSRSSCFWCRPAVGGCDANWPLDTPAIFDNMTQGAKESIVPVPIEKRKRMSVDELEAQALAELKS